MTRLNLRAIFPAGIEPARTNLTTITKDLKCTTTYVVMPTNYIINPQNNYLQGIHKLEKRQTPQMDRFQRLSPQQCQTRLCLLPLG